MLRCSDKAAKSLQVEELDIFSAKTLPGGEDDDDHKAL